MRDQSVQPANTASTPPRKCRCQGTAHVRPGRPRPVCNRRPPVAAAPTHGDRPHHILEPTALVTPEYSRIVHWREPSGRGRRCLLRWTAGAVRRTSVDAARRRDATQRGSGHEDRGEAGRGCAQRVHVRACRQSSSPHGDVAAAAPSPARAGLRHTLVAQAALNGARALGVGTGVPRWPVARSAHLGVMTAIRLAASLRVQRSRPGFVTAGFNSSRSTAGGCVHARSVVEGSVRTALPLCFCAFGLSGMMWQIPEGRRAYRSGYRILGITRGGTGFLVATVRRENGP